LNPNPQQGIQNIKDSDCSLVSSKNFSEILPHNNWRPGPGKVGQGGLKSSTYDVTHKNPAHPAQWLVSYGVAKWCRHSGSIHDFKVQYIHTGGAGVNSLAFGRFRGSLLFGKFGTIWQPWF